MKNTEIETRLSGIEFSKADGFKVYPCRVICDDGKIFERVVVCSKKDYDKFYGQYDKQIISERDRFIDYGQIKEISESFYRLPSNMANHIYDSMEMGMGYYIYALKMTDGVVIPFVTGDIVDFPNLDPKYSFKDIIEVYPRFGREILNSKNPYNNSAEFKFCVYE